MAVLSVVDLRDRIETPASDVALQSLLDAIEADIVKRLGAAYPGPVSEEHAPDGRFLFLKRRLGSVTTVTEYTVETAGFTAEVLTANTDYLVWAMQGKLERRQAAWGARVVVAYVPADDTAAWAEAELDLARIALSRSALKSESVGGEYSFTAPDDWEREKARVLRRLSWLSV